MRPQWEIDAIDALEDARERRAWMARLLALGPLRHGALAGAMKKTKKGRGQRRNRRNRR